MTRWFRRGCGEMAYKIREDVVLENVCGSHILVALRPAWKEFPFAMKISGRSALIWESVREGKPKEHILASLQDNYNLTFEEAASTYDRFISYCKKHNYFISEDAE